MSLPLVWLHSESATHHASASLASSCGACPAFPMLHLHPAPSPHPVWKLWPCTHIDLNALHLQHWNRSWAHDMPAVQGHVSWVWVCHGCCAATPPAADAFWGLQQRGVWYNCSSEFSADNRLPPTPTLPPLLHLAGWAESCCSCCCRLCRPPAPQRLLLLIPPLLRCRRRWGSAPAAARWPRSCAGGVSAASAAAFEAA